MTIVTVVDGKLMLPENVLKHLGVKSGERIAVELLPEGKVVLTAVPANHIRNLFGLLYDPNGPTLSIEEIKSITEDAWAGKR